MGLFGSKYKHYQDISFQPLRSEPYEHYAYAKKQIIFALGGNLGKYGQEIAKYKRDYKKSFSQHLIDKLNITPYTTSVTQKDFSVLIDYLINEKGISDFDEIHTLEDHDNTYGDEDVDEVAVCDHLMEDTSYPYKFYDNDNDYEYYTNFNTTDITDDTVRLRIVSIEMISDGIEINMNHRRYTYTVDADNNVTQHDEGEGTITLDSARYYFAKAYYFTESDHDNTDVFAWIPPSLYPEGGLDGSAGSTLEFFPLMKMRSEKQIFGDCRASDSCTAEQEKKWRNQKRALKSFGVALDSIENALDNDQISDYRVGLAVAPDDAVRSVAIAKYMYRFFDHIGGERPEAINSWGLIRNRSFSFEINGLEVEASFSLREYIESGTIPRDSDVHEYKVKVTQAITNRERYYNDVKELYDDNIGGSLTDIEEMYNAVVSWYHEDTDDDDRKKAYNQLPPEDYKTTKLGHKYLFAFCKPSEFEDVLKEELFLIEDDIRLYNIDSYKVHRVLPSDEDSKYYAKMDRTGSEVEVAEAENGDNSRVLEATRITIYKQITSSEYRVFEYEMGRLEYEVDGHTAKINHDKADGTFRFFALKDIIDDLSYKEYVAVYDMSLCGMAYCHQRVKLKWYQRAGFRLFLQIAMIVVSVVITVGTGGAGASVGAALTNVAMNLAIAMAITYVAQRLASSIGGDLGVAIATIAAVAAFVYTGQIDPSLSTQMFLKTSDMYIKLKSQELADEATDLQEDYNRFKREIDVKARLMAESLEISDFSGYSTGAILENINNRRLSAGSMPLTKEYIESIGDSEWKLDSVPPIDYNLAETLYNRSNTIPPSVYDFEPAMQVLDKFGDTTNG
jgi:hypothetical protein